ncbi:FAS1 domain-containing protein [Basidiobolus meristosporus CBS 931.73]|uniref:FAS1 domain-containing protein n=1 Tax=Basidiobolus meristosporus CBS 931.73 TaxID=1314790 RepID=A0A1Y1YHW3_9FUNG|nr:FAS1 domain-containing protein [Basidiobolus meristosporus CBS 931.73]|eukprot:ORX97627.1 FAS1 domain-containing protein [Basidiobolus meristosporus CBS 931.73]
MRSHVYLLFLSLLSFIIASPIPDQYPFSNEPLVAQNHVGYVEVIQDGKPTLGDIIPTDKSLSTFLDALMRFPDLANAVFDVENELTIVAPVNAAFQKYNIVEHFDELHDIVASHIITRKVNKSSLKEGLEFPTLNSNQPVRVGRSNGGLVLNNKARFLEGGKEASNGNLYRIDTVFP